MNWLTRHLRKNPDEASTAADAADASTGSGGSCVPSASKDEHAAILVRLKEHLVTVVKRTEREISVGSVDVDVNLYDAGYLDSMTASEFLIYAEKDFGVKIPDWVLGGAGGSLAAVAQFIDNQRRESRGEGTA
ncbi:MAG: acyl carrier protein [Planctomycetales bacterium]|nr:acyl carrier protein [Planctomycetales bacterium]